MAKPSIRSCRFSITRALPLSADPQHPNLLALAAALATAESPLIVSFLRYMQRIHPAGRLPGRAAIDPMDIPDLLGNVVLTEVHRQPNGTARFFVRVAGEAVLHAAPAPMMNRFLDQPGSDVRDQVRQQVLSSGVLYYWRGKPRLKFRFDYDDVEYVHCPLAEDGSSIDRIFSAFYYRGGKER